MGTSPSKQSRIVPIELDSIFDDHDSDEKVEAPPEVSTSFLPSLFSKPVVEEKETVDITKFIYLINYKDFITIGQLPRNPDHRHLLTTLDKIQRETSFILYISHAWVRTDSSSIGWEGKVHPDYRNHHKYQLILEGVDRSRKLYAPAMRECFLWMDFCCLNQNSLTKDVEPNIIMFDKIITYADCLFTPIFNDAIKVVKPKKVKPKSKRRQLAETPETKPEIESDYDETDAAQQQNTQVVVHESESEDVKFAAERRVENEVSLAQKAADQFEAARSAKLLNSSSKLAPPDLTRKDIPDHFAEYTFAPLWNDLSNPKAYLSRSWCRLELLYAAVMPLLEDNNDKTVKRRTKFVGTFRSLWNNNHRPHILYTSHEHVNKLAPVVLPVLSLTEMITRYHPTKGAHCSLPGDLVTIKRLHVQLKPLYKAAYSTRSTVPDTLKQLDNGDVFSGDVNAANQRHGQGMHKDGDKTVYKGTYQNDMKAGYGVEKSVTGVEYFGEYDEDQRTGHGLLKLPNGDQYEGFLVHGKKHGQGKYTYANGDVFTGQFEDDLRNGPGECRFSSGDSYTGMFGKDVFEGYGTYNFADGHMYQGQWVNGLYQLP